MELKKNSNCYFEVNQHKAVFFSKMQRLNHIEIYKHAVAAQINPILFAIASNNTRIACHRKAMDCFSNSLLCRLDTDSIMLTFPRNQFHIFYFKFRDDFKIEESSIVQYISLKPRSYQFMRSNNTICIKCTGLKMSLQDRHKKYMLTEKEQITLPDRKCFLECINKDLHFIKTFAIGT